MISLDLWLSDTLVKRKLNVIQFPGVCKLFLHCFPTSNVIEKYDAILYYFFVGNIYFLWRVFKNHHSICGVLKFLWWHADSWEYLLPANLNPLLCKMPVLALAGVPPLVSVPDPAISELCRFNPQPLVSWRSLFFILL